MMLKNTKRQQLRAVVKGTCRPFWAQISNYAIFSRKFEIQILQKSIWKLVILTHLCIFFQWYDATPHSIVCLHHSVVLVSFLIGTQ